MADPADRVQDREDTPEFPEASSAHWRSQGESVGDHVACYRARIHDVPGFTMGGHDMLIDPARRTLIGVALLASPVFLLQACMSSDEANETPPAVHAVESARLEETMHQLNQFADVRLPQELEAASSEEQRAQVKSVALALSDSARDIAAVLTEVALSEEHRTEFTSIADRLQGHARSLHEQAGTLTVSEMKQHLEGIRTTCQDCHQRFRVMPAATDT